MDDLYGFLVVTLYLAANVGVFWLVIFKVNPYVEAKVHKLFERWK